LAKAVKHLDPSPPKFSGTDWQTLGELKVLAGSDVEAAIQTWLAQTLAPLELQTDFASKISRSAHEAAARALDAKENGIGHGHIHLAAFAPPNPRGRGQTWGFFRLEKLEGSATGQSLPGHSIEFYLYIDG
jgi:hypothetical protein